MPRKSSFRPVLSLLSLALSSVGPTAYATDWAQPPVGCVEELVPQEPAFPCLNLSGVKNPSDDFPADMSPEEKTLWTVERKRALSICRARETARREAAHPGSMPAPAVELAWMRELSLQDTEQKTIAIYDAAESVRMPPHVLIGALMQESLMANLGIAEDGGNYSCGIGQLNLSEYCGWAESASASARQAIGWPVEQIAAYKAATGTEDICHSTEPSLTQASLIKPFYQIALTRLAGLPEYRLMPEHFRGIRYADVAGKFPAADENTQRLRYALAQAFIGSCSGTRPGILAKAKELRRLYDTLVPSAIKRVQTYRSGQTFARQCQRPYPSDAYPLSLAWLIADGIYNAGSVILPQLSYYLQLNRTRYNDPATWAGFGANELVESLYWGGRYDPRSGNLRFKSLSGASQTMTFYKACVAQRHIARVVQHVTLPGFTLADSIEGDEGCAKNVYDSSGRLKESRVPLRRQTSSGHK